jgi:hypothetical protein
MRLVPLAVRWEFWIDPQSDCEDPGFQEERPLILDCALAQAVKIAQDVALFRLCNSAVEFVTLYEPEDAVERPESPRKLACSCSISRFAPLSSDTDDHLDAP